MKPRFFIGLIFSGVSGFFLSIASSCSLAEESPVVAIIIDDMGNQWAAGMEAINLPGHLTYSFLPFVSYTRELADQAVKSGKEIMLHVPMQALGGEALGPGGLTLAMGESELKRQFAEQLATVPNIAGINNHMGSALTQNAEAMAWVMDLIRRTGKPSLFFVDSLTTDFSVANKVAEDYRIPALSRDVFLDHDESEQAVRAQFEALIALARRRGYALAIGHPKVNTIQVLREKLAELGRLGIELVPVSKLFDRRVKAAANTEKQNKVAPPVIARPEVEVGVPTESVRAELRDVESERFNEFDLF